ncbi:1-deoxy-D-xylulose-5-phosphate reductoisomerase [bacterium]|nr:1-deoxy-D-xylulose-5-phosphate reductoisomerase [bacterium]
MKKIALLGSTGSIGTQTLDVIENIGGKFDVVALAAGHNLEFLRRQIRKFHPKYVCISDEHNANILRTEFSDTEIFFGDNGLVELACLDDVDIVVNAIVGAKGLIPSYRAIDCGKRLCTANKESLVMAGEILTERAKETGAVIFPIDSEHSALFQSMLSGKHSEIKRLILTASGGPFWNKDVDFDKIIPVDALAHPNWSMGQKISIDSATMMNKALEIIEARWLFDIPLEKIDVLIHPQSIVHSIVEFVDGSQIAQLSLPDMRLPIQYALTYPERFESPMKPLDLAEIGNLEFCTPNKDKFPAIDLAYRVLTDGGNSPIILNTVNELAVESFLMGEIKFSQIVRFVIQALDEIPKSSVSSLDDILSADRVASEWFEKRIRNR